MTDEVAGRGVLVGEGQLSHGSINEIKDFESRTSVPSRKILLTLRTGGRLPPLRNVGACLVCLLLLGEGVSRRLTDEVQPQSGVKNEKVPQKCGIFLFLCNKTAEICYYINIRNI